MGLMKTSLVGLVGLLIATNGISLDRFYNGAVGAINENSVAGYIKLRRYSVVLDGKEISSVDLLRLKNIAKSMHIPNIMFINNRFLVFGDYQRSGDAKMIRRKLQDLFDGSVQINVAESAVFGRSAVVTPILVGSFRERNRSKYDGDTLISDSAVGGVEHYDVVPASTYSIDRSGVARDVNGEPITSLESEKYSYDNSGYDEATEDINLKSDEEAVIELFKNAKIFQSYVVVGNEKIYIDKYYKGYKIIDINYADKSFLIRSDDGDTFLIEGKIVIKL
jgi:hypothetical protein